MKNLNTGTEEFDFKRPVLDAPLLPYQLLESGLPDLAATISAGIDSVIVTGRDPIQGHLETSGTPILNWA